MQDILHILEHNERIGAVYNAVRFLLCFIKANLVLAQNKDAQRLECSMTRFVFKTARLAKNSSYANLSLLPLSIKPYWELSF